MSEPLVAGPPALRTSGDRWLASTLAAVLGPEERVLQQAFVVDHPITGPVPSVPPKAAYAALTGKRLLLLPTRVGVFGPRREHRGVESIPRSAIAGAERLAGSVQIVLRDGRKLSLQVPSSYRLSNQPVFLRDVPRLLGAVTPVMGTAAIVGA